MKVAWVRLGDVLAQNNEKVSVEASSTYPMIGVRSFGRGAFPADTISGTGTAYKTLHRVSANQVLYPKLMAWEGAFDVVPDALAGRFASPEFQCFDINTTLANVDFVKHLLHWPGFIRQVRSDSTGTNVRRQRLQPETFLGLKVPLPSRADQDRIAAHLTSLESKVSACPDSRLTLLQNRLTLAATNGAEDLPLSSLLRRDRSWLALDPNTRYSPIGIRGFGRGVIRYPEVPYEQLSKLRYYRLQPGALLVSNIKAWEGAVGVVEPHDKHRIASNRFLQYRSRDSPDITRWLHLYLTSATGTAQLGSASPGSADRNRTLSMESFEALVVPVPSAKERKEALRLAKMIQHAALTEKRRNEVAHAVLPAARNEIFSAMR